MPNLTFNAIDVETANRNRASICQIGMAQVHDGKLTNAMSILVNPEEPFESVHTGIHGIDSDTIKDAETIPAIYHQLHSIMEGTTLVSHTRFDQQALEKATTKYGLRMPQVRWLDSAQIARQAWPQKYGTGSPSLMKVMADLGITFQHHDAGEDAKAAAQILLHAHHQTNLDVDDWLAQANQPKGAATRAPEEKTSQAHRKEKPAGTQPISTPKTHWAVSLPKILALEQDRDFNNSSVIGGLDSFLRLQAKTIAEELGRSGIHRVLLRIPYSSLTPYERSWWADQWLDIMGPATITNTVTGTVKPTSPATSP